MDVPLLDALPRLLAQGHREAQCLLRAATGRYRERAVRDESVRGRDGAGPLPHRVLCGDPTRSLAALSTDAAGLHVDAVCADLRPANDGNRHDTPEARLARWIPRFLLLRQIAPGAIARVHALPGDHAALRWVLDALWPEAMLHAAPVEDPSDARHTLVVADGLPDLPAKGRWIACAAHAGIAARLRGQVLADDGAVDLDHVGATPAEWARRRMADPLAAMHAALAAFGATPLAQTSAGTTPTGRRRAGMEVLLGECRLGGARTLVWVDAPDRRTGVATLCRASLRRTAEVRAWERVVVLGWHFTSNFAQQLALRCDAGIEAFAIRTVPARRGASVRIDAGGFRRIEGLTHAWIERRRTNGAPDHEWLTVRLGDADATKASPAAPGDWSIDPAHDGEVFRGAWHALRDGTPGVRSVRLRLPCRAGPRRVCVRAVAPDGQVSEVVEVVPLRDAADHRPVPADPRPHARHPRVEALC